MEEEWLRDATRPASIASNGGGRSGAFLALDANLELLQRTGQLDVYEYGRTLANSRQHLVDTVDQYMFIYDVLCEAVLCSLQPIGMHQLKNRSGMYKARKDRELMEVQDSHENKLLLMLTAPLRIGDCAGGHRLENRGKNRDVMVVPPDHARPYLQTLHGESKDYTYINAVEVDGFTRKSEFIVTEWPKVPTLDSFWTLVFDHNVHTVICLTNQPTDIKQYPQFVHNKGKRNYGPFTVEIVNYQQYPGLQSHMVKISKRVTCIRFPVVLDGDKRIILRITDDFQVVVYDGNSEQWAMLRADENTELDLSTITVRGISETFGHNWHRFSAIESKLSIFADGEICVFKVLWDGKHHFYSFTVSLERKSY
uniref:Tyrosine-protein phosphatase domain-containing protein n=1 Tax=Globodera pallida TaxID=36090 RepID=A0A183BP33_GLOPA